MTPVPPESNSFQRANVDVGRVKLDRPRLPPAFPSENVTSSMAYDVSTSQMILFGGIGIDGNNQTADLERVGLDQTDPGHRSSGR